MQSRLFASACALAMVAGAPALADEAAKMATAPVEVVTTHSTPWEGAWVGGALGIGSTNYNASGRFGDGVDSLGFELPDLGGQGGLFGIEAGYDFAVSPDFVVGVQADFTMTNVTNRTAADISDVGRLFNGGGLNGNMNGPTNGEPVPGSFEYTIKPRHITTVAARAGFLPNDTTLVYGLLGYSRASFKGEFATTLGGAPMQEGTGDYSFSDNGIALGAGIETMMTDNISLKLEYRFNRFGTRTLFETREGSVNLRSDVQSVRAVVSYRF